MKMKTLNRTADGPGAFLKMTNFGEVEFDAIWDSLNEHVVTRWNVGRGRQRPTFQRVTNGDVRRRKSSFINADFLPGFN